MGRKEEILQIFSGVDKNVLTIVEPMLDELVFIECQLEDLRTKPFIKYNPNNPNQQKSTPAYKVYKDLLAQEKDMIRILCSQLHKDGSEDGESPLRAYLKRMCE